MKKLCRIAGMAILIGILLVWIYEAEGKSDEHQPAELVSSSASFTYIGQVKELYGRDWDQLFLSEWYNKEVELEINRDAEPAGDIEYRVEMFNPEPDAAEDGWQMIRDYEKWDEEEMVYTPQPDSVSIVMITFRIGRADGTLQQAGQYLLRFDTGIPAISLVTEGGAGQWYSHQTAVLVQVCKPEYGAPLKSGYAAVDGAAEVEYSYQQQWNVSEVIAADQESSRNGTVIRVGFTDAAGNSSEEDIRIFLDFTAPEVSISGVGNDLYRKEETSIQIEIAEQNYENTRTEIMVWKREKERILLHEIRQMEAPEELLEYRFAEEGNYYIRVELLDGAGNCSTEELEFIIDMTVPELVVYGAENGMYSGEPIDIVLEITEENLEGTAVSVELEAENGVRQKEMMKKTADRDGNLRYSGYFVKEGKYVLTVSAIDKAGNEQALQMVFFIDYTPPRIEIYGVRDGQISGQEREVRYVVSDENVINDWYIKGTVQGDGKDEQEINMAVLKGKNGEISGEQRFAAEGIYTVTIGAEDAAGNYSEQQVLFIVDLTSPVIRCIEELDGQYFQSFSLPWPVQELVEDLTITFCNLYLNGEWYNGKEAIDKEGFYVLLLEAEDEAGNRADARAGFYIDRTPPAVIIEGVKDGGVYRSDIRMKIQTEKQEDWIQDVKVNGENQEFPEQNNEILMEFKEEGDWMIEILALDYAGNTRYVTAEIRKETAPHVKLLSFLTAYMEVPEIYRRAVIPLVIPAVMTAVILGIQRLKKKYR